jgi:hypothetical protein
LIPHLEAVEQNAVYEEDLRLAQAIYEYYAGDRAKGLDILNVLVAGRPSRGIYFNRLLGLWLQQQDIYAGAADYFKAAVDLGDSTSLPNYAIALSESGQWPEALVVWSSLARQAEGEMQTTARQMQVIGQGHTEWPACQGSCSPGRCRQSFTGTLQQRYNITWGSRYYYTYTVPDRGTGRPGRAVPAER